MPEGEKGIGIVLAQEEGISLGEYQCYRGYRLEINDSISICANDFRGAAQVLYYMEDMMELRRAPYLEKDTFSVKPAYSPNMVHSGYGIDEYKDEHLNAIAHAGRDVILVFTKGVNQLRIIDEGCGLTI